jgi:hypothetical protein
MSHHYSPEKFLGSLLLISKDKDEIFQGYPDGMISFSEARKIRKQKRKTQKNQSPKNKNRTPMKAPAAKIAPTSYSGEPW